MVPKLKGGPLGEFLKRAKARMTDSATGPNFVAAEVVVIAADWAEHREEAGGLDATTWLKKWLGFDLAWFTRRHEAIERLGRNVAQSIHHEVAVWLTHQTSVDVPTLQACVRAIMAEKTRKHGVVLTLRQAERVCRPILGKEVRTKTCARCTELEQLLKENGIDFEER